MTYGVTPKQYEEYVELHGCNYTDNGVAARTRPLDNGGSSFPDIPRYTAGMYKSLA